MRTPNPQSRQDLPPAMRGGRRKSNPSELKTTTFIRLRLEDAEYIKRQAQAENKSTAEYMSDAVEALRLIPMVEAALTGSGEGCDNVRANQTLAGQSPRL